MTSVNAVPGRNFLLKNQAGSVTVTGVRATKLTINSAPVDITNKGSLGHQEWLVGAGVDNFELTCSGVYDDGATGILALQGHAMPGNQSAIAMEVIDAVTGETYSGLYIVPTFELDAPYNTERTFSTTLRSQGAIAYTPGT